jgi:hypothetical protein
MAKLPGFNLEMVDTPSGPLLSLADLECRGLCRLVNGWVTGELPDLLERLRNHERVELDGAECGRPPASLDLAQARAEFIDRTGLDPDEEGGFVIVDGEPYPLYTLDDIGRTLGSEREEWTKKRRREAELRQHQERVAAILPSPDPLFSSSPSSSSSGTEPSPQMRELLLELEARARLVDELEDDPKTHESVEPAATLSAKRRFLLLELYAYGLLGGAAAARKLAVLERWRLPLLAGWLRAAVEHEQYQHSPERAEMAPGEPIRPVLFSTISVDWFRRPTPTPPKVVVDRLKWTAWCEREAARNFEEDRKGAGWWIWHSGSVTHTFYWRYENGETAALYKVT